MNIIKTRYFLTQLERLERKFPRVSNDINSFEQNISLEPFSRLGDNILKFRIKKFFNSNLKKIRLQVNYSCFIVYYSGTINDLFKEGQK